MITQYMVLETFLPGCKEKAYARFFEKGRMLPNGLFYIDSWLEEAGSRCFQLMETDDPSLFQAWIAHWSDLTEFEVIKIGMKPGRLAPSGHV